MLESFLFGFSSQSLVDLLMIVFSKYCIADYLCSLDCILAFKLFLPRNYRLKRLHLWNNIFKSYFIPPSKMTHQYWLDFYLLDFGGSPYQTLKKNDIYEYCSHNQFYFSSYSSIFNPCCRSSWQVRLNYYRLEYFGESWVKCVYLLERRSITRSRYRCIWLLTRKSFCFLNSLTDYNKFILNKWLLLNWGAQNHCSMYFMRRSSFDISGYFLAKCIAALKSKPRTSEI